MANDGAGNSSAVEELFVEADSKQVEDTKSNKSPKDVGSKGKKEKSPKKSKEKKEKSSSPPKGKNKPGKRESLSPVKVLSVPLEEKLEDIQDKENPAYDTSKLTVAEYYEMMDLKPGLERETYLKEKLKRYQEKLSPSLFNEKLKHNSKKLHSRKGVFSDDFEIIGTLKNNEVSHYILTRTG